MPQEQKSLRPWETGVELNWPIRDIACSRRSDCGERAEGSELNRTRRTQKETRGEKNEWRPGSYTFRPLQRLEQAIRDRVESGLARSKEIESGPALRRVLHDRGKKRVKQNQRI